MLEDPETEVIDIVHLNRHMDRVCFRRKLAPGNLARATPRTNNLTLAIYVTSQARLKLFSIFEEAVSKLNRLLYCDTGRQFVVISFSPKIQTP